PATADLHYTGLPGWAGLHELWRDADADLRAALCRHPRIRRTGSYRIRPQRHENHSALHRPVVWAGPSEIAAPGCRPAVPPCHRTHWGRPAVPPCHRTHWGRPAVPPCHRTHWVRTIMA